MTKPYLLIAGMAIGTLIGVYEGVKHSDRDLWQALDAATLNITTRYEAHPEKAFVTLGAFGGTAAGLGLEGLAALAAAGIKRKKR